MTPEDFAARLLRSEPTAEQLQHAVLETKRALNDSRATTWLRTYYSEAGNYAGSTFSALEPNDPWDVTAADLFATTLLNVKIGPRATRTILSDAVRNRLTELLRSIPLEAKLQTANANVWLAADELYQSVKSALGRNPWVTASKLCARKRPEFFPVRDNVVTMSRLGIGHDWLTDWLVYKHLMRMDAIVDGLRRLEGQARTASAAPSLDPPLRILDVLLWMSTPEKRR